LRHPRIKTSFGVVTFGIKQKTVERKNLRKI